MTRPEFTMEIRTEPYERLGAPPGATVDVITVSFAGVSIWEGRAKLSPTDRQTQAWQLFAYAMRSALLPQRF